jgi:flavin-dependent dehydrogenase
MAERQTTYDVVVVGGRIAGSLSAILFAQAGARVVVVDRARFPSPTLSTHFFRGDGLVRVLAAAGVLDDVLGLGPPPLVREYAYLDGSVDFTVGPPQDPGVAGYCLSVRREPLDATLLGHAREVGAEVITSTSVSRVVSEDNRAVGVELADGSVILAGLVVGADGRRSTVARDVQAADHERHGGKRALYYRYVADMPGPVGGPPDGPEFSLRGDELVYVFPSDAGLTCVAVSVNLDEYDRMRHAAAERFDELLSRHCGVWDRYHASTPLGRLFGTGPQDDFVRQAAGPGWALVGDAGIHQDPWSGMGMDTAGVSAALLVEQVAAAGGPGGSDAWVAAYERSREVVLPAFHSTVAGAADLSGLFG